MMLQVGIYAVAAQRELEYEPNQGLVRYLDVDEDSEHPEIEVPLNEASVNEARNTVVRTAEAIQARLFFTGPSAEDQNNRCSNCDFVRFCGQHEAQTERQNNDRCT
jgi:DNA helicase-2/ATP-dependent DNA helicase PcrA